MAGQADAMIFWPQNLPRSFKKVVAVQIFLFGIVIYLWYSINGGFIPKFLLPRLPYFNVGPDIGPLIFFNVDNDASKIKWARETNSLEAVKSAMGDPRVHMISGDVILRGHGTRSQSLVPVMARPPKTDSDITLKDWLQEIKFGSKGIRLHLHSVEAVEISLQVLSDFHKQSPIKFPVWVHADILPGPHAEEEEPAVDSNRFIKKVMEIFPKCTLSLGWTTGTHTDLSQSAYSWETVFDMLDIVQEWESDDQLIVFQARLSLVHNSVPQLKWLRDNVKHSSLMIWHEEGDQAVQEDIMYLSYRFPPESVFFDLNHKRFQTVLEQYRHFSRDKVDHHVLLRDEVMFKPDGWLKMGFHRQKNSILASTEALLLTTRIVHIVSKSTYLPTSQIHLQGRVRFFNRENRDAEDFHTGINIYVRPLDYSHFDNIQAIRCFIGVKGELEISGSNLPSKYSIQRKTSRITPSHIDCFRFKIVDDRDKISFFVKSMHDCTTLESVVQEEELIALITVDTPERLEPTKQHPFVIKMEDSKRQVLIDELSIKSDMHH